MPVREVIPFLSVASMERSLAFYVDGLGFELEDAWRPEGEIRWCQVRMDGARIMLQQFDEPPSERASMCLMCDDAIALYRTFQARGVAAKEPFVGNHLWVTGVEDPDGNELAFESPTDVAEETKLSEIEAPGTRVAPPDP